MVSECINLICHSELTHFSEHTLGYTLHVYLDSEGHHHLYMRGSRVFEYQYEPKTNTFSSRNGGSGKGNGKAPLSLSKIESLICCSRALKESFMVSVTRPSDYLYSVV